MAEGHFGGFFGWPNFTAEFTGGFMGMPATGKRVEFRVIDFYRREGDKLAENWIFIDLLHLWAQHPRNDDTTSYIRALTWGNKKKVHIPLSSFVAVRKGKTTDRTRRNSCPASRLLSLVTNDKRNISLDIEAPTQLDRDKFAKAFSRFLMFH